MYSQSLSSSESPYTYQDKQELSNHHQAIESSPIPSHSGFNLIAKRTPIQSVKLQNHQQNSMLTTYRNNSSEESSCNTSNIKPQLNGQHILSRQASKQLPHHQQQISNGSTCEHSELRSFFSDNQHFTSHNHFSGKSAEEREQQSTQINQQMCLQVSQFNIKPSDLADSPFSGIHQTLQNAQKDVVEEGEAIGTCPQHPTKKVKYQMNEHPLERFCSNCAVELARQEFEMDKIMGELKNIKGLNDMIMESLNAKLTQIRGHCLEQTQKLNGFFAQIENELYTQKTAMLTIINDAMWKAINVIEEKKNQAKLLEYRFLRNEADILRNRNKVEKELGETEVSQILKSYQQELDSTKGNLNEILLGTQFQLAQVDSNKLANDLAYIKKLVSQDIMQPSLFTSSLLYPNLNIPGQQIGQITPLITGNENNYMKTEQIRSSRRNESQEKLECQIQQQYQQYRQPDITNKSILETGGGYGGDSSMSEKQQTQESEDLGMQQSNILQNDHSKISNKTNISSNKIISYTDLHQQSLREGSNHNDTSNQNNNNISNILPNSIKQYSSNTKNIQFQSPPNSQKSEGFRLMSTHKVDHQGLPSKHRQAAQTEPTHLPCNKFKQVLSGNNNNNTGYQRNLMMNEEIMAGNNNYHNNSNQYNLKYKVIAQTNNKNYMLFQ